jgi:hypothetical protein
MSEQQDHVPGAVVRITEIVGSSPNSFSEVFSTDWSFGAGQDQRCGGDGADALRTQPDVA